LVAGANGISGTHMMRVMRDHPKLWKRVYALSRRPALESFPSLFSHHAIDLLDTTPEQVAAAIKAEGIVSVDKVFFYVYAPQASVANKESLFGEGEELAAINGKIMHNLLEGLWLAGLRPKRILLQTGGKGVALWASRLCADPRGQATVAPMGRSSTRAAKTSYLCSASTTKATSTVSQQPYADLRF
jgi:hypothetical protein